MKLLNLAAAVAASLGMWTGANPAFAQQATPASYAYDNYYAQDEAASPSDAAPAASCGCDTNCDLSCDSACDACGCSSAGGGLFRDCCLGEPWKLFGETCSGITAGGHLQLGVYTNEHNNANNGPLGFNDENNGLQLHQAWFYLERAVDTGGCGWDWGFRMDYVFGVDGPDTQAFGNFNGQGYDNEWDASSDYGSALPQLYAEIGYNDWTVKLGHFYTLIGYEVVAAPDNFFFSHSYAQYYAEPFTHTGALATYTGRENLEIYGGYVFGWDTGFDDGGDQSMFLGGTSAQLTDNATLTWILTAGDFGTGNGDLYMNSVVFQYEINDCWTYVMQHDLGIQEGEGNANEWYGLNNYLLYTINDCWQAGLRAEWFRDDDGARVVQGAAGNYYNITAGLNWRPHANVVVRPEVRYDWYDGIGPQPFDGGAEDEQASGGVDVIFTF